MKIIIFLLLISPLPVSSQALAQTSNRDGAIFVTNLLNRAVDSETDDGRVFRQGFVGHIDPGSSIDHTIRTDRANRFVVRGYCDQDCNDIDIEILNSRGVVIVRDTLVDDEPVVSFGADNEFEPLRIRVRIPHCGAALCYYSVGTFSS